MIQNAQRTMLTKNALKRNQELARLQTSFSGYYFFRSANKPLQRVLASSQMTPYNMRPFSTYYRSVQGSTTDKLIEY